jgi:hypothetical protein
MADNFASRHSHIPAPPRPPPPTLAPPPHPPPPAGITWSDVKAALAAIAYILSSAVRSGVDENVLNAELQQLGLPKENSDGISRPFRLHRARLTAQAAADSLRAPRLLSLE